MSRLLALVAFAVLVAFLGILVWRLPRLDLGVLVGLTILFVAYDLFVTTGGRRS